MSWRIHQLDQCQRHMVAFRDGFSITEVSASLDVFPRWGDQMVTFCSKIGGRQRWEAFCALEWGIFLRIFVSHSVCWFLEVSALMEKNTGSLCGANCTQWMCLCMGSQDSGLKWAGLGNNHFQSKQPLSHLVDVNANIWRTEESHGRQKWWIEKTNPELAGNFSNLRIFNRFHRFRAGKNTLPTRRKNLFQGWLWMPCRNFTRWKLWDPVSEPVRQLRRDTVGRSW